MVALGLFVAGLIIMIMLESCLVSRGYGYWIELFNGATWPGQFAQTGPPRPHDILFFVFLALRTLLNLGVVLSALYAVYWLFAGGPGRLLMRNLDSVLRIRDTAFTGYLIDILDKKGVPVPPDLLGHFLMRLKSLIPVPLGSIFYLRRSNQISGPDLPHAISHTLT
jgi:hypothetical protein